GFVGAFLKLLPQLGILGVLLLVPRPITRVVPGITPVGLLIVRSAVILYSALIKLDQSGVQFDDPEGAATAAAVAKRSAVMPTSPVNPCICATEARARLAISLRPSAVFMLPHETFLVALLAALSAMTKR